jgi:hypothetical protein
LHRYTANVRDQLIELLGLILLLVPRYFFRRLLMGGDGCIRAIVGRPSIITGGLNGIWICAWSGGMIEDFRRRKRDIVVLEDFL